MPGLSSGSNPPVAEHGRDAVPTFAGLSASQWLDVLIAYETTPPTDMGRTFLQLGADAANGLQEAAVQAINDALKFSGAHFVASLFGRNLYLTEPADWSNGLFYGKEPAWFHTASKFIGGQALLAILSAGASESGLFCKLSKLWGGTGCFTGDTGVVTGYNPDGTYRTTAIADVKVGDYVLSRDENDPDGPVEEEEVTGVERHEVYALQDVTVVGLSGQPETIQTTAGHPFYVEGQGWTDAGALSVGERVELPDGTWATVTVNAAEAVPAGVAVYNLTVDGDHTYFVDDGTAAVWVHNAFCPSPFGRKGDLVTQATFNAVERRLLACGYTVEREVLFRKGLLGLLSRRAADIVGTDPRTGKRLIIQIGRMLKNGLPVKRERLAIVDIVLSPNFDRLRDTIKFVERGTF